jgi:hypothetical protein
MRRAINAAWKGWKAFAHRLASVQAKVFLGALYFAVLPLFAALSRIGRSPFESDGWLRRDNRFRHSRETAQKQS